MTQTPSNVLITRTEPAAMPISQVQFSQLPLRPDLQGISPYGAPQISVPICLNVNENPHPPSAQLVEAIEKEIAVIASQLHRYPDRDAIALREKLAQYISDHTALSVNYHNIWVANGSNEIIQQIFQAFAGPGRCALGTEPSYSMHPIIAQGTNTQWFATVRNADFSINCDAMLADIARLQPAIIFITRPNNPTGNGAQLDVLKNILDAAPAIVVVDEAYGEFSAEPSAVELQPLYPHKLIVCRTMSKAFAFAGGRVGYLIADPAIVSAMFLVRLPYHLSAITQVVASVAIGFSQETLATVATIRSERDRVRDALNALGYFVYPSEANFLLFGRFRDNHYAWQSYLDQGILIRDLKIPHFLRVSIGLAEENDAFLTHSAAIVDQLLSE